MDDTYHGNSVPDGAFFYEFRGQCTGLLQSEIIVCTVPWIQCFASDARMPLGLETRASR